MKRFHGMVRARGWGLQSVSTQVKLTVIAVNIKRIAALVDTKGRVKTATNRLILKIELFLTQFSKSALLLTEKTCLKHLLFQWFHAVPRVAHPWAKLHTLYL